MQFDDRELQLIKNQEFLLTKNKIIRKVQDLLDQTKTIIRTALDNYDLDTPQLADFKDGKISRGENYRGLPYLVLDYPAVYRKNDIFAFRTMFWWGNFFSISFHMQGTFLDHYRTPLLSKLKQVSQDQYFVCVGESPWEYHFGEDNYRLLAKKDNSLIENLKFLKLGKKYALDQWNEIPELSVNFVSDIISLLE